MVRDVYDCDIILLTVVCTHCTCSENAPKILWGKAHVLKWVFVYVTIVVGIGVGPLGPKAWVLS